MSDAPTPDPSEALPSVEELRRTAVPAAIRHAPRVGRMVGTGVGIGVALGVVLGIALPNSTGVGRGVVVILLSAGFALIGGLIAGVIATRIDRPLPNHADGPLFPQDAVVTEQVATTTFTADAVAGVGGQPRDGRGDAGDDSGVESDSDAASSPPQTPPSARPNGDTT